MAKPGAAEIIILACDECKQRNYTTKKKKKNHPDRLEMKKYCRFCRKHTSHKETKQFLLVWVKGQKNGKEERSRIK